MIDRESESVSKQRRKEGREGGKKEGRKEEIRANLANKMMEA